MRQSIRNRAAAIRQYLNNQDDLSVTAADAYRYSITAAQWEAMRLLIDKGNGTAADDRRFAELGHVLRKLSAQIGLVNELPTDFLPRDPSRLIDKSWQEAAEGW
ncbi:hypothetical protein [Mycobacterium sp. 852002-30065_SCH5024008]|uniref:hypothetical protein n=1 Tax=Mycobacterium sp. 852002-30065_SCH5024008 TaxID=1834088 RepID=UPI000800D30C|nr:hypothetical protein [Mycobacterium sp. 852002-30065_SCH5024008]OBB86062.1 hypothetical protein A5781_06125 [Mycobacterium sp. 852002-30065_SCH5024008]